MTGENNRGRGAACYVVQEGCRDVCIEVQEGRCADMQFSKLYTKIVYVNVMVERLIEE